ncbi:hypothetical protein DFQ08_105164 [Winogradskyella arenosi]|uniref:Zinc-dependent peptidase n=1 Tax=Winogradskyella arenosi TaxID=533325 RepID=A0A368ZF64_9FLAO|nr:zinc-dependent peptidase [Winogradskyella arenosi]RCW90275.1 hypothetical protein DFQ08_105164 [Winogradskyella arenosi]
MLLPIVHDTLENSLLSTWLWPLGLVLLVGYILYRLAWIFQFYYASFYKKPVFAHVYLKRNRLTPKQLSILQKESTFYNRLAKEEQAYFHHRVATFIKEKEFVGQSHLEVTEQMRVTIAATAIMLTFGFKNYLLEVIETVIIYPQIYYSEINGAYHKGETNPRHKAIVFSWEDFKYGYKIGDDNLNLGIHEFGHAVHLNAAQRNDISSLIFNQGFVNLTRYLQNNESVRRKLIASKYFRAYAYTNQYEFFAVLLENFIETPSEFNKQFPVLYKLIRQMLNFKFAGY